MTKRKKKIGKKKKKMAMLVILSLLLFFATGIVAIVMLGSGFLKTTIIGRTPFVGRSPSLALSANSGCSCAGKDYCQKPVNSTICGSQVCGADGHYYKCARSGYVYAGGNCSQSCSNATGVGSIPYYFIAIHCEPYNGFPDAKKLIENDYKTLQQMVSAANSYKKKLTIMFSAQWMDYINQSQLRKRELKTWKNQGHEIGGHHHGVEHGNWDGFSNYPYNYISEKRIAKVGKVEPYLGNLKAYSSKMNVAGINVSSGCMNEEEDKSELPDSIVYSTCSGYANSGPLGTKSAGVETLNPDRGMNDYVIVGSWNGITRKWLSHYLIPNEEYKQKAIKSFGKTNPNSVYGVIAHSTANQYSAFYSYLNYVHQKDPRGSKSKTVSQVINQKLLPEKWMNMNQ